MITAITELTERLVSLGQKMRFPYQSTMLAMLAMLVIVGDVGHCWRCWPLLAVLAMLANNGDAGDVGGAGLEGPASALLRVSSFRPLVYPLRKKARPYGRARNLSKCIRWPGYRAQTKMGRPVNGAPHGGAGMCGGC